MAAIKKMQKGGSTTKKKVDNSITGKIQRGIDYMLGSDKLRATGVAANKAIKPYADKTRTAMNKTLAPIKPKSSVAKMQKGGSTTSKKVDNSITGKMQRGLDYMLGSDNLRAKGVAANKAIKPYADKTRTAMNKALRPVNPKPLMAKKMQDGGSKVTRGDIKDAQREAKLKRIQAGTEPSTFDKVSKITGDVANVASTVGQGIKAVQNAKGSNDRPGFQKGGGIPITAKAAARKVEKGKGAMSYKYPSKDAKGTGDNKGLYLKLGKSSGPFGGREVKKSRPVMQKGGSVDGPIEARRKVMGEKEPSLRKTLNYVKKKGSGYIPPTESNKPDTSKWAEKYKSPNAKKMQKGGGVASGVNDIVTGSKKIGNSVARNLKPIAKTAAVMANPIGTGLYKGAGMAGKSADDMLQKRYPNYTGKGTAYSKAKSVAKTVLGYKKGGSKKK